MGRIKVSKTESKAEARQSKEWPTVVYFWIIGLGFISYLVARFALDGYSHPYHWASGIAGALLGVGIGWLWYYWRGDVL